MHAKIVCRKQGSVAVVIGFSCKGPEYLFMCLVLRRYTLLLALLSLLSSLGYHCRNCREEEEQEDIVDPDVKSGRPAPQLRRFRRSRVAYERLQRPEGVAPGDPIPSIEGWVLLLRQLPETTQTVDIRNLFASHPDDPEYFGNVNDVKMPLDDFGNCTGWALVELDSKEGFDRAIQELDGCEFKTEETDGTDAPLFRVEDDVEDDADAEVGVKRERNDEDEEESAAKKKLAVPRLAARCPFATFFVVVGCVCFASGKAMQSFYTAERSLRSREEVTDQTQPPATAQRPCAPQSIAMPTRFLCGLPLCRILCRGFIHWASGRLYHEVYHSCKRKPASISSPYLSLCVDAKDSKLFLLLSAFLSFSSFALFILGVHPRQCRASRRISVGRDQTKAPGGSRLLLLESHYTQPVPPLHFTSLRSPHRCLPPIMLNLSEFMIDSDEDSDDAASPPPPPPAPVQLRAPTPDSPTPQAPALQHNFNEVNEEPVLHQVPSAPSDPPAQPTPPASVHSHASSTPFEPAKPAPAVERTPRSWRGSRHSNLSHSAAVPPEPHSSAQATPPVLSAPTPEPSYSRTSDIHDLLHSDARRRATEASEREELQSLESRGLHGAGGASASALHVAASEAGSDKPHKKKFNKELFERLSKPLAVHVKYEERRRKEEEEKAAAQQAEAQSKQAVLLPVAEANWRVNRGRFQLSDLPQSPSGAESGLCGPIFFCSFHPAAALLKEMEMEEEVDLPLHVL
eukprot:gene12875-8753_t